MHSQRDISINNITVVLSLTKRSLETYAEQWTIKIFIGESYTF